MRRRGRRRWWIARDVPKARRRGRLQRCRPRPGRSGRRIRRGGASVAADGMPRGTIPCRAHDDGELGPAWEALPGDDRHPGPLATVREGGAQRALADGFQGALLLSGRCHPRTILDAPSRFSVGLIERYETVKTALTAVFRRDGLSAQRITDNGPPRGRCDRAFPYPRLTAWLIRLGIGVGHSRPLHPRRGARRCGFHRTLQTEQAEAVCDRILPDVAACPRRFTLWRSIYHTERPHEALDLAVPASLDQASGRAFPEGLPPIEYGDGGIVRKVQAKGEMTDRGQTYRVAVAFRGRPVAVHPPRPTATWRSALATQRSPSSTCEATDEPPRSDLPRAPWGPWKVLSNLTPMSPHWSTVGPVFTEGWGGGGGNQHGAGPVCPRSFPLPRGVHGTPLAGRRAIQEA